MSKFLKRENSRYCIVCTCIVRASLFFKQFKQFKQFAKCTMQSSHIHNVSVGTICCTNVESTSVQVEVPNVKRMKSVRHKECMFDKFQKLVVISLLCLKNVLNFQSSYSINLFLASSILQILLQFSQVNLLIYLLPFIGS